MRPKIYSTITIKTELYNRLKKYAKKNGFAIATLIAFMIEQKLHENKNDRKS